MMFHRHPLVVLASGMALGILLDANLRRAPGGWPDTDWLVRLDRSILAFFVGTLEVAAAMAIDRDRAIADADRCDSIPDRG